MLPVRSEAALTIPTTPTFLKKVQAPSLCRSHFQAKTRHEGEKYVSVAQSVALFSSRTPPRFHVAPANVRTIPKSAHMQTKFKGTKSKKLETTKAQSPNFQPMHQRRPVKSAEEIEENMMKGIKPFKV